MSDSFGDKVDPLVKTMQRNAVTASVAAERERCAKVAEWYSNVEKFTAADVAARIRNTGPSRQQNCDALAGDRSMKPEYRPVTIDQKIGYLVEECGEVLAAVGKTQRWGLDSFNPEPGASRETNSAWILRELSDLEAACAIVRKALDGSMGGSNG